MVDTQSIMEGNQMRGPKRCKQMLEGMPPIEYVMKKTDRAMFHCWSVMWRSSRAPNSFALPVNR